MLLGIKSFSKAYVSLSSWKASFINHSKENGQFKKKDDNFLNIFISKHFTQNIPYFKVCMPFVGQNNFLHKSCT